MQSRIPAGSREYLLDRADQLASAFQICSREFESWGARRIMPSTIVPFEEVLEPTNAVTFTEPETGRLLALRQDLTNQVRRIVDTELKHLPGPLKLYYIERVWRSRAKGSRTKEQIQAGAEWIDPDATAEKNLLGLGANLVRKLTGGPATFILGHAELRSIWMDTLSLRDEQGATEALDSRNLSLWQKTGDPAYPDLPFLTFTTDTDISICPEPVQTLVQHLLTFASDLPDDIQVVIDPIGSAENSYYTGLFFNGSIGVEHDPLLRGGRYDGRFENSRDAIGFTLDLDPLIEAADAGQIDTIKLKK